MRISDWSSDVCSSDLLLCDYVLLAEGTILTTPFVNLALVPEAASSLLLPLRIGHARAFAAFALGEPIAAADAHAWGIANRVVERSEEHTSELQSLMRISYAVFCLKKKKKKKKAKRRIPNIT